MKRWRPWTDEDDIELRKALAEGISLKRLIIRMKRAETTIRRRAKALGLTVPPATRGGAENGFDRIVSTALLPDPLPELVGSDCVFRMNRYSFGSGNSRTCRCPPREDLNRICSWGGPSPPRAKLEGSAA